MGWVVPSFHAPPCARLLPPGRAPPWIRRVHRSKARFVAPANLEARRPPACRTGLPLPTVLSSAGTERTPPTPDILSTRHPPRARILSGGHATNHGR
eukprot:scaffold1810_cov96-Isochrysis_galbana.AAC.6